MAADLSKMAAIKLGLYSPYSARGEFKWISKKGNVDKKALIRNNRIPHPALNTKRERDTYN